MQQLTPQGQQIIQEIAQRYFLSVDAVTTMLQAVSNGGGTMAQFYHNELGGGGQWMLGGMTMVGDMFDSSLKYKVDSLCTELSNLLTNQPLYAPPLAQSNSQSGSPSNASIFVAPAQASGQWWPAELGIPSSTGAQNNVRYAVFPSARRLVVEANGNTDVYDTLDHQIGGVSQQQGYGSSVTFNSQYGTVSCLQLPLITRNGQPYAPAPDTVDTNTAAPGAQPVDDLEGDIFQKIERLAELLQKGILTEQEFTDKKKDLLAKL